MERILVIISMLMLGVVILLAPCLGQQSEQIQKDPESPIFNTKGCSNSWSAYTECKKVELQCNNSRRIQIVSSNYGNIQWKVDERLSPSTSHDTRITSDSVDHDTKPILCSADSLLHCDNKAMTSIPYNSSQRYDLYKKCSWKSTCQPPSLGTNIFHSISHRCVPEQPKVSFCSGKSLRGHFRHVNIVFNKTEIRDRFSTVQNVQYATYITQCECNIESASSFQVSTPDLRMVNDKGNCIPNAKLSGISKEDIICSTEEITLNAEDALATKQMKLSFDVPPEFIWIIIQAGTGETQQLQREPNVTVNCHLPINLKPPSTTTSTDKTSSYETKTTITTTTTTPKGKTETTTTTTTTTTTGITDTTANNHTQSTTLTTENPSPTPAGNEGYGQEMRGQRDTNEGGVPLPAIIVPIVVTFIAAIVFGIIMWRRRLLRQKKDDTGEKTKVTYQVPTTNGQISHYESAKPNRTDDNYLVLEQEHVYNTIASEHDKSVTINSKDVSAGQNNIYQTTEPRNNNASGINEENAYTPLNAATIDRIDNSVPNVTTTLQSMPPEQTNEYFTLEPKISSRTPMDAKDTSNINCPDHIDPNKGATLQDIPPTQSNEYFILEPQKTVLSGNPEGSPDTNKNSPDHKGKPETEASLSIPVTQTNEYFIVEPHNTVSSGNPASVEDTNNEILGIGSTDDREADQANDDGAGHDYFVLEAQSSPSPDDKLEGEMVDNSGLPENQHSEEKHEYFTLEPNELKEI